jgi:hypothetical protein
MQPAPVESYLQVLAGLPTGTPPSPPDCRRALQALLADLNRRVVGQETLTRRVLEAALLNRHVLLEGLPGEAKTTCVMEFAALVGLRFQRISFRPDMLPGDLIGKQHLVARGGTFDLEFRHGPLFAPVVVADEINRAPPKVQAATLEAMQERRVTRIDQEAAETVYHPHDRATLARWQGRSCFGIAIPHPDDDRRVPFSVAATQNPLEFEGTYPLSEAQIDRLLFLLLVDPAWIGGYTRIVEVNLCPPPRPRPPEVGPDEVPLWLRTVCLFEHLRRALLEDDGSPHRALLRGPVAGGRPGLWDRVRLAILLTHYRHPEPDALAGTDEDWLPSHLRDRHQARLAALLAGRPANPFWAGVRTMLASPLFRYVQSGSSPRGLIDWPRAAIAEAFLTDDAWPVTPRRRHFRAVAGDVLRHRLRLLPQARADRVTADDVVELLVNTLLPDSDQEAEEDRTPVLPEQL